MGTERMARSLTGKIGVGIALILFASLAALAQDGGLATRAQALDALAADAPGQRAAAVIWFARNGAAADDKMLAARLSDDDPRVRNLAEQGMWLLWNRSGDAAIDALMAKGGEEMEARQFKDAIATFSDVIKRKPGFAEGWNKRATVLFLSGDLKRSLADCDQVLKRNPYHFGALAGYGQIYFQQKQYAQAIVFWKRALSVNPNMTSLETNIGVAEELLAESRKGAV